ncbi:MAG: chemotaxis protein CheA [Eubacteriales bacterium]|nr:chemotaxis protein CheA [Eubacteriales bacterium]
MISDFEYVNDSMLEMYLFESTTLLEQLDAILLQSEKEEYLSTDNVNEIFRIMHTIKGSSAMMEFNTISHVSHKLEDLFYVIREDGIDSNSFQELFDLVLKVSDFLKDEVEKIQNGHPSSLENDSLSLEITDFLEQLRDHMHMEDADAGIVTAEVDDPDAGSITSEVDDAIPDPESGTGEKTYFLHIHFSADCQMENIRAYMLLNKLETVGKILTTIPEELNTNKDASSIISHNGFYCSISTSISAEELVLLAKGTLSVETVKFIDALPASSDQKKIDLVPSGSNDPAESKTVKDSSDIVNISNDLNSDASEKKKMGKQNLINVDLNKLDALMDLVGEIVITESMVSGNADLAGLDLDNFNRASRQLRKLTDELQDIVMSIRMIPIASTFQKMRRIVRDMGKKLNKDVNLILMGETTEVDKTIIDGIADPLMHLVRNAMDHAIEDKSERISRKKDPAGRIILSAQNIGGDIIITVSDDGKGLDSEMILEKAKEKNLLLKPEEEYTEKEIFNLLTVPGFSTKSSVTEFSGRGVGMDVVRKNIEKIGGTVTIESEKGVGTNIFFKIPLTLAIISSMEIRVGENIYAIPITNIRESFKAESKQLFSDPDNNEMIMIRGSCYPIIRLHRIFHLQDTLTNITEGILMLVDSGGRLACIFADELMGKHQVVVKPLPLYLRRYSAKGDGIAGCTILGDGSISLILDVQGIINQY